jgi:formate dehydrogenase subunit gamma
MNRDPNDLPRYTAGERANHWIVAICFVLMALSGLAFFHPALFWLAELLGGGPWARILHPYIGLVMIAAFALLAARVWRHNLVEARDKAWLRDVGKLMDGDDASMPEQGKYNGGQKLLFWSLVACLAVLLLTGLPMWRALWKLDVTLVRTASLLHAATAAVMIGLIIVHVYAGIWTKGSLRAMIRGTVTRAWAWQHHRAWYRKITGHH